MFMHGKFLTVAKTNKKIVNLQVHLDVLLHLKENLDFHRTACPGGIQYIENRKSDEVIHPSSEQRKTICSKTTPDQNHQMIQRKIKKLLASWKLWIWRICSITVMINNIHNLQFTVVCKPQF